MHGATHIKIFLHSLLFVFVGQRDDAVVMASHAIFPRDGGMEAPSSVVGLQFQHSALFSRFMTITSKTTVSKQCIYIQSVLLLVGEHVNRTRRKPVRQRYLKIKGKDKVSPCCYLRTTA
jgi:hypothetical protein